MDKWGRKLLKIFSSLAFALPKSSTEEAEDDIMIDLMKHTVSSLNPIARLVIESIKNKEPLRLNAQAFDANTKAIRESTHIWNSTGVLNESMMTSTIENDEATRPSTKLLWLEQTSKNSLN